MKWLTLCIFSLLALAFGYGLAKADCPPPPGKYVMTYKPSPGSLTACPDLVSTSIDIVGTSGGGSIQGFGFNIFLNGNIKITAVAPGFVVGTGAFLSTISADGKKACAVGYPNPGSPSLGTLAVLTLSSTGAGPFSLSFGGTLALSGTTTVPVDHLVVQECDVYSGSDPALQAIGGSLACPRFIRSDCNNNGVTKGFLGDIVILLNYSFLGGIVPDCMVACDANDDEVANLSDAVYMMNWQFLAGPPPKAPFGIFPGGCGTDTTPGTLSCDDPICP